MSGWSTVVFTSKTRNRTFYCAESWQSRSKCKSQVQFFLGLLAEAAVSLLVREKFELLEVEAPAVSLLMRLLWCFLTRLGLIYEAVASLLVQLLQFNGLWTTVAWQQSWLLGPFLPGSHGWLLTSIARVTLAGFHCKGHVDFHCQHHTDFHSQSHWLNFHCQGHVDWLPLPRLHWATFIANVMLTHFHCEGHTDSLPLPG